MKAAKLIFSTMILCAALIPMHASTQTNGEIRYQSNILEFWNGTSWTSTDVADTGVSCSGASPGEIRFNTSPTPDRMEFCNGTNWRRMDATVTGEACTTAGEIELKVPENIVRYCNGGHWVETMVNVAGITCPTGYVVVPADGVYTFSDFCVAKYEMKNNSGAKSEAAGTPWTSITRNNAQTECRNLGAGYDLISNSQWQTIARNIEGVAWNWDTGVVGGGAGLNHGHADNSPAGRQAASTDDNSPCTNTGSSCDGSTWHVARRTNKLSNGEVIWDMNGNVGEWTNTNSTFNYGAEAYMSQVTAGYGNTGPLGLPKVAFGPSGNYASFSSGNYGGLGKAWINYTNGALFRGGIYNDNTEAGIFSAHLYFNATTANADVGFRCVHNPAPVSTTDLAWDNVVLLVQPKSTDTSVLDYSSSGHVLSPWQGAALSTAVSDPWGGTRKVIFMDGNDDRLIAPNDSADWDLTGHFTIEFWVYFNLLDASRVTSFIEHYESGAKNHNFGIDNLNNVGIYMNSSGGLAQNQGADNLVATGQWHHFAFQRFGNQFTVYQNGVAALQFNSSSVFTLNAAALAFMGTGNNGNGLHGYLGAIRFTNGVARYQGNFIPPIATFPVEEATPLHHWELDETSGTTASDSVGSLDGTLTNGPVWQSSAGLFSGALDFDGVDDYVSVPNTGNVFLTVPFTWSAWVKADTLPSAGATNRYVIEMVHSVSPWEAFGLWADDAGDLFKFTVNNSAGTAFTVIGNAPLVLNQWYHLAVTVDSGFASKLYVNGVSQGTPQTPGSLYAANGALWIGKAGGANQGWQGLIDDVRFFDKALRQEEIDAITDARIPDYFDFVDVYGATLSTSYQVAATVTGFTGPLTAAVSGGDAQIRKNGTGTWGSSVSVNPGDILNLRMTSSGSASTGIVATVTLGTAVVDWRVDTTAGSEYHYFVAMSSNVPNGNLGGLAGANSTCLANLQSNNWMGKSNVFLDSSTVKAWLCDGSTCQNTMASKTYAFALSGTPATGGGTFTTDASALGPGDATGWNLASTFGTTSVFYWTGRNSTSATQWANTSNGSHCSGWTSSSSGVSGMRATSNSTIATRWLNATSTCDSSTRRLICLVDYTQGIDQLPSPFYFLNTEAPASTLVEESTVVGGFVGPVTASVSGNGAEIRANHTGSWVTSGLSVQPGDTINVRMTSSSSIGTTLTTTVTVGTGTATWWVTTEEPGCPAGFVRVPNDGVYTTVDFCVMKYEAKAEVNVGGSFDADGTGVSAAAHKPTSVPDNIPWRSVDRAVAISECQSLGAGFNLISNAQWQTIARNIEAQNANWTGGTVGNGCLTQGNNGETTCGFDGGNPDVSSSNSRGIQVLSNGRQIHDLAGNVSEWVKDNNATNYGANDNTVSITAATHTTTGTLDDGVARSAKAQFGHAGTYTNVSNSRGLGFANLSAPAGAITRGAGYTGTTTAGIFGVNTAVDSTFSNASWGFRCVSTYTP